MKDLARTQPPISAAFTPMRLHGVSVALIAAASLAIAGCAGLPCLDERGCGETSGGDRGSTNTSATNYNPQDMLDEDRRRSAGGDGGGGGGEGGGY